MMLHVQQKTIKLQALHCCFHGSTILTFSASLNSFKKVKIHIADILEKNIMQNVQSKTGQKIIKK